MEDIRVLDVAQRWKYVTVVYSIPSISWSDKSSRPGEDRPLVSRKSTLSNPSNQVSSAIIEDLKSVCAADESYKLAYFYFTFRGSAAQSTYGDPTKQSTFICLASLLRQICSRAELPQELITLYDNGQRDSRRAPSLIDIQTLLPSLVRGIKKVFIVLDALDECPEYLRGLGRAKFLKWILELSNECPNVQILLTSRNDLSTVDIAEEVRSHSKLVEVSVDATKTRDDIRLYITKQFNSNPVLRKINEISNVDIPAVLQEKSDGMFVLLI